MKSVRERRLLSQRLATTEPATAVEVVRWLGAVQAQLYDGAKWALALRSRSSTDAAIERAFSTGRILRTHVLRPTWHFVTPQDIRWMLALTGPRISKRMAPYNRHLELDEPVFRRSRTAMIRALAGGKQLTRQELKAALEQAGIRAGSVQRLAHIVMQAELDAVICSGGCRGRQFTYSLLDERVPASRTLSRDEALVELARRYFRSHGPAQIHDFVWWSGLTAAHARAAIAMLGSGLSSEVIDGKRYWSTEGVSAGERARRSSPAAYLLPLYDEYLIAYKDRSAALDAARWSRTIDRDPFGAPIVVNGRVVGGWKRSVTDKTVEVVLTPFESITRKDASAIASAAREFSRFLGRPLRLSWA